MIEITNFAKYYRVIAEDVFTSDKATDYIKIPVDAKRVNIRIDRKELPQKTMLRLKVFISFDDDISWKPFLGCGTKGGVVLDKDGTEMRYTTLSAKLPIAKDGNRLLRVDMIILESTKTYLV